MGVDDRSSKFRLSVDIGGTFTDAILIDMSSGAIARSKVPTTPKDPSIGFMNSIERIVKGVDPSKVTQIVHSTTVATNAIIEGKVAEGALVVTRGFRDILEIQRQIRPKLYDVFFDKPKPLIPRYRSFEVSERITAEGEVITPLSEGEVREIARKLRREKIQSVAICFLHSYLNPAHEKRAAKIISEVYPEAFITESSEVSPQFREYFRASTAVINAVVMPIVANYLSRLESQLERRGFSAELSVMQSNGGLMKSEMTKRKPAHIAESGPAAGAVATAHIAKLLGLKNAISFDMGGTTAKVGLVEGGVPKIASSYEVGAMATAEIGGLTRGSGYPLRTPVVDLVEIGAGGGSIAWVDSGGALRVGPQSAGAVPGPACYPNGGTEPTITDANLILGRLDADYFLGGEIKLSKPRAEKAIMERCGRSLNKNLSETANWIIEIANVNMLGALRLASVERGYDPREFVLVAFGGAGPMHANALAKEMNIPRTLIPPSPGLFSAMGLLFTDIKHDYAQTYIRNMESVDIDEVETALSAFEKEALKTLKSEAISRPKSKIVLRRSMEMRYVGQSYELPIAIPAEVKVTRRTVSNAIAAFHKEHERVYGHSTPGEPIEVVNLKLTAVGVVEKPKMVEIAKAAGKNPSQALARTRDVFFPQAGKKKCGVYNRYKLKQGNIVAGPAIIEELDSTTVVYPDYEAQVGRWGLLTLQRKA